MVAIGSLLSLSCRFTVPNPDHCNNNDGDAYCVRLHPDGALPYCEAGTERCITPDRERYGCVAERPKDECYSPCGGGSTITENGECLFGSGTTDTLVYATTASATTNTASGDSASSTTGPMLCVVDENCTEYAAPQCVEGECTACVVGEDGNAACSRVDPTKPVCAGGECVQCTPTAPEACMGMTPVCDDTTDTCGPCTAHDQCSSGACELKVGSCFPSDALHLEVDGDGPADHTSISLAINAVNDGSYGVLLVREMDEGSAYGPAIINAGKTIALLAAPGEAPIVQGGAVGNPGLRVSNVGTTLYMDGLSVSNNPTGRGLLVDLGACAWVDRSYIVRNYGGGILVQNNAELNLRNSFVGSLGDVIAVEVNDSSASVLYSTLTASTFGNTPALSCATPITVDIRNSIIVSQGGMSPDELSCTEATIVDSATEAEIGAFSTGWFAGFNVGDYHLTAAGTATFVDVANWIGGDPTTDIDGDIRPDVNRSPDYAGADVPP